MTTPCARLPFGARIMAWAALAMLVLPAVIWPAYMTIVHSTGATGWEMRSLDTEQLHHLETSASVDDFLQRFGASSREPIHEQLSYIGSPGPFTRRGNKTAFVFVPEDRVVTTPLGTLIVFDRSQEELMQQQSLRNICLLASLAGLGLAVFLAIIAAAWNWALGRPRQD